MVQFASSLGRGLCKTRLIFPRINDPVVSKFSVTRDSYFMRLVAKKGQLKGPKGLAIDKSENLVVCDNENNRLQIFSLDGKFLNSVAEELKDPWSVAIAKNGDLLVCDFTEDCIHIMN